MSIFSKILSGGVGDLIGKVGDVVDKFVTTGAEKEKLKQEMLKLVQDHEANMEAQLTERMKSEDAAITERWKSDMQSDSWLSKNTRPLVMLCLLGFFFVIATTDSIDSLQFDVKSGYVTLMESLLMVTVGAYFGSRGLEKIQKIRKK